MKVIFMGTPKFAIPTLEKLLNSGHEVLSVFTQPDKPIGRKQHKFVFTPVKDFAIKNGLKVYQPLSLRNDEIVKEIKNLEPEVIVVVAYGQILPRDILDIPLYGCINVHGSLLPKYRGAAPIQYSIVNGDKVTGVTTMLMDNGLDTGNILLKDEMNIFEYDTTESLSERMSFIGGELLIKTIDLLKKGEIIGIKQDESLSSYTKIIKKSDGKVNWKNTSVDIYNLVRGMYPWPVAYTHVRGNKVLKIYKTKISGMISDLPGKVMSVEPFVIGCGGGTSVELLEVQLEGKKRMMAEDFVRGYKISKNDFLGDDLL